MAILKPHEIGKQGARIRMIIAGHPGIGKTTLALSAPSPLLIDTDRGVQRVKAMHRRDCIVPGSYAELLQDLQQSDLSEYETLVIDTGGELLNLMKAYVIEDNPKNSKKDGALSLQGYGAVGAEFVRFMSICYYSLKKHVVIVFHAKEEKDGDNTVLRLLIEGSTRNNVWQPMDLGGFIEMSGNNRVLSLANNEKHFGKVTYGICPEISIPQLDAQTPNDILTQLFRQADENIKKDHEAYAQEQSVYEQLMHEQGSEIEALSTPEEVNAKITSLQSINHALTSERELKRLLAEKAKHLGFAWDEEQKAYVLANSNAA